MSVSNERKKKMVIQEAQQKRKEARVLSLKNAGHSNAQISELTGISESTVYSILNKEADAFAREVSHALDKGEQIAIQQTLDNMEKNNGRST